MAYAKEVYRQVSEQFRHRREQAAKIQQSRREQAYAAVPEIRELDLQIKNVFAQFITRAMQDNAASALSDSKEQSIGLQIKRAELLYAAGFDTDYLELPVKCKKCGDQGYIGTKMCACFQKALKKVQYEQSNISSLIKTQTFDKFDIELYPDRQIEKLGRSMRDYAQAALDYCKKYGSAFGKKPSNIIFTGPPGIGKTFLSSSIAKEVIDKGFSVIYESAQNLFGAYEKERFDKNEQIDTGIYLDCDLLIIDDLGAEFKTSFSEAMLYNVLNSRINLKRPIIISTNIALSGLRETYSERIASRLWGEFVPIVLYGEDIRIQKLSR